MKRESVIVWFRDDLRLADNPAFMAAVKSGLSAQLVYLWAPAEEEAVLPSLASIARNLWVSLEPRAWSSPTRGRELEHFREVEAPAWAVAAAPCKVGFGYDVSLDADGAAKACVWRKRLRARSPGSLPTVPAS